MNSLLLAECQNGTIGPEAASQQIPKSRRGWAAYPGDAGNHSILAAFWIEDVELHLAGRRRSACGSAGRPHQAEVPAIIRPACRRIGYGADAPAVRIVDRTWCGPLALRLPLSDEYSLSIR